MEAEKKDGRGKRQKKLNNDGSSKGQRRRTGGQRDTETAVRALQYPSLAAPSSVQWEEEGAVATDKHGATEVLQQGRVRKQEPPGEE